MQAHPAWQEATVSRPARVVELDLVAELLTCPLDLAGSVLTEFVLDEHEDCPGDDATDDRLVEAFVIVAGHGNFTPANSK